MVHTQPGDGVEWSGYGDCGQCGARAGKPCGGLGPHVGRPFSPAGPSAGPVLTAVRADLEAIDETLVPGGRTYKATVLWLAETIDSRGSDDGPSVTAKLADQLTRTMQALTRQGETGRDTFDEWSRSQSSPVMG